MISDIFLLLFIRRNNSDTNCFSPLATIPPLQQIYQSSLNLGLLFNCARISYQIKRALNFLHNNTTYNANYALGLHSIEIAIVTAVFLLDGVMTIDECYFV